MKRKTFLLTTMCDYLNESNKNTFVNLKSQIEKVKEFADIKGGFLNELQVKELKNEIESNYSKNNDPNGIFQSNDIRKDVFNYDNPLGKTTINGIEFKIVHGLIRNKRSTFLLYADGEIIGEFYHISDIKKCIKYAKDNKWLN
jgi:hypothetical protein